MEDRHSLGKVGIYMARERKALQSSYDSIQETHKVKTFHKCKTLFVIFTENFQGFSSAAAVQGRNEAEEPQLASITTLKKLANV